MRGQVATGWFVLTLPAIAIAYPGGTPDFQTNVAPFCAGCHSSRSEEALAGTGEAALKQLAERKHMAVILEGKKGYESLTPSDREALAEQIRALDEASTVSVIVPKEVMAGSTFQVTVNVTGGGGPVVGVALVDRDHRWHARPASAVGWQIAAPPSIVGPDGQPQTTWLERRPADRDRNLSFVNITGIASDPAAGTWSSAKVVFSLRAPDRPGNYPLAAAYLYGTEKSTILGYTTNSMGRKSVRGGFTGGSGRVMFSPLSQVRVTAAQR
jgi:hypothetical protein